MFLWVANFQGLTVGFACLLTLSNFHHWIYMSNQEYRVFHSSGYLTLVGIPNTRIFLLCDCETYFGRCPILPSPPSNTKHSVNLYHALIPMSCDVSCINAMQCHCMCNASKYTLVVFDMFRYFVGINQMFRKLNAKNKTRTPEINMRAKG